VDYFRLDLSDRPVKTALKATLTGILKVDVALFLYLRNDDGSLSLVQTSDRAKGDAPEVIRYAADPGIYLFKVQDSKNGSPTSRTATSSRWKRTPRRASRAASSVRRRLEARRRGGGRPRRAR
jgi:hypothetical protein